MANTTAKIPTQKNLVKVINAEIEASNDIMKIVIEAAKNCGKFDKVSEDLKSYDKLIKYIFGDKGILISITDAINNINTIKFNNDFSKVENLVANLNKLIFYITKEINKSNTIINSTELLAFNNVYFNFISKLSDTFNIVNKFDFNFWLGIKLLFIRMQLNTIKNFISNISDDFSEISSDLNNAKILLLGDITISFMQMFLIKLSEIFNTIYSFKINFIQLLIKLTFIGIAIKIIFDSINNIGEYGSNIDYESVIKSTLSIVYLVVILNALKNIFDTVNTIKIGIKFYIKLYFLKKGLKRIFNLIEEISTYNNVKINFSIVKSFFFTLIILKQLSWIFTIIKNIRIRRIKSKTIKIKEILQELFNLIIFINENKIDKQIKNNVKTNIDYIRSLIASIRNIVISVVIIGILSILCRPSLKIINIFIKSLIKLLDTMNILFERVSSYITKLNSNIRKVSTVFLNLILISAAILAFALISIIVAKVIINNIIPFLIILAVSVGVMFIMLLITEKLSELASKSSLKIALYILIISAALILASVALLVLTYIGKVLREENVFINLLIIIGGIIVLSLSMIGLGIALTFATPFILLATLGFAPLVALLMTLTITSLMLMMVGSLNINFGEYDSKTNTGTGVKGNIGKIINLTKFLKDQFNEAKETKKVIKQGKRLLRQVKKTVRLLKRIAKDLNFIQNIELKEDTILEKVGTIFNFVSTLEGKITTFLSIKEPADNSLTEIAKSAVFNIFNNVKQNIQLSQTNKKLNKVEKVIKTLTDIGQAMTSLQNLKIDETLITTNVENMFTFINSLNDEIAKFMKPTEVVGADGITITQEVSKKDIKQADKKLSKIESVLVTIQTIGDALNTIKNLGFQNTNNTLKTDIMANIKGSFDVIKDIATEIKLRKEEFNKLDIDDDDVEYLNPIIRCVQDLNNSIKIAGDTDPTKVKTNIDNYIRFVDKVNTIEVDKLETTTNMFKQMSKFSDSIKGDFDKLAESLSDKLLPVLIELKNIMSEVPSKLDIGFQNTSASIAATNSAPTRENIAAQLNRENPNLSQADVDAIVAARLNEKANSEANSMSSKLDELISLLKGMSGETVVVKMT